MNDPSHPEPEITEDDFFAALAAGDAKRAAEVLRSLKELGQGAVETLADLLEGDPVQQNFFPYRLELRRWGPGRARNFLGRELSRFKLRRMINEKLKTEKKVYLAVAAVAKQTHLGPSTVWDAWGRTKKTPPKS